jgi:hypothetical protein
MLLADVLHRRVESLAILWWGVKMGERILFGGRPFGAGGRSFESIFIPFLGENYWRLNWRAEGPGLLLRPTVIH